MHIYFYIFFGMGLLLLIVDTIRKKSASLTPAHTQPGKRPDPEVAPIKSPVIKTETPPMVNLLHNRYRIERELDYGGMAFIKLARDMDHNEYGQYLMGILDESKDNRHGSEMC